MDAYSQDQSRDALRAALVQGDPADIGRSLLAVVNADPDRLWLESECLELLGHPDAEVRGLAATSIGHIARIHGRLRSQTIEQLRTAMRDPAISGRVEDALADLAMFLNGEDTE